MPFWTISTLTDAQIIEVVRHYHDSMKYEYGALSSEKHFNDLEISKRTSDIAESVKKLTDKAGNFKYPNTDATLAELNTVLGNITTKAHIPGTYTAKSTEVDATVTQMLDGMKNVLAGANEYIGQVRKVLTNPSNYSDTEVRDAKSFHPDMLKSWLRRDIGKARDAIEALHKKELDDVTNHDFQAALAKDGITEPDKQKACKDDIITKIKERQKKEIDAFDALKEEENNLHKASQKRYEETLPFLLAQRAKANEELLNQINIQNTKNSAGAASAAMVNQENNMFFEDVTPEDLKELLRKDKKSESLKAMHGMTTVRGRTLSLDEEGKLSVTSSHLGGMGTWGLEREDAFQLAANFKALGKERITITVSHIHEATEQKLAVWAIEEAQRAGYDLDKITIKMKNEKGEIDVVKPEQLQAWGARLNMEKVAKYSDQEPGKGKTEDVVEYLADDFRSRLKNIKNPPTTTTVDGKPKVDGTTVKGSTPSPDTVISGHGICG